MDFKLLYINIFHIKCEKSIYRITMSYFLTKALKEQSRSMLSDVIKCLRRICE